ncbi:MAG: purine-nucleoside phosphorylase [Verrucomicrobiota bacterium]|jgi:purine-nucleoside phosphorylase
MNLVDKDNDALNKLRSWHSQTAIILGSGLSSIVPNAGDKEIVPYAEFGEIPQPSVPGHAGRFVLAKIENVPVIVAQGRVHLYEGWNARQVTASVRVLAAAGVKNLVVTNAAGSINPKFRPGTWMMISDHLNLTGTSPLAGAARLDGEEATAGVASKGNPQFIDLTEAYSRRLRERFARVAAKEGIALHEGVYAGLLGPQYETPAEVRMLQRLGADAVGMSTVLEVIQARALEVEVVAFSCLTNLGAGLSDSQLSHEEVLQTGQGAAAVFSRLLSSALPEG